MICSCSGPINCADWTVQSDNPAFTFCGLSAAIKSMAASHAALADNDDMDGAMVLALRMMGALDVIPGLFVFRDFDFCGIEVHLPVFAGGGDEGA